MPSEDTQFKKGNPGGSRCKGKRISTWMVELGEMRPDQWPHPDALPANGQIALARIQVAMGKSKAASQDTQIVADLTESKKSEVHHFVSPEAKEWLADIELHGPNANA